MEHSSHDDSTEDKSAKEKKDSAKKKDEKEKPQTPATTGKDKQHILVSTSKGLSSSKQDAPVSPDVANSGDRGVIRRRASELKMNEKKKIRSVSYTNMEAKDGGDEEGTGTPKYVPRALKRDRTISGSLSKKTKGIRSVFMKQHTLDRNFSVDNGVLTYSGKEGKEPNFKTPLEEVKASKLDIKNDVKKGKFAFQIETPKRNFVLYADTEEERENWLQVLRPRKEGEGIATATQSVFKGELECTVGSAVYWVVQGVDKYGQLCVDGGNRVTASIRKKMINFQNIEAEGDGEPQVQEVETTENMDIIDNNDGTYIIKLLPKIAFSGKLSIHVEGDEIHDSPMDFVFKADQPSLKNSILKGNGLKDTKMYLHSKIMIIMNDQFDNPSPKIRPVVDIITKDGQDSKFDIKIEPREQMGHIWDAIYIADKEGEFKVIIRVDSERWGEYPVTVTKAPASAQKSTATGPGLKKVYQYKQTTFKILVNDERSRKCPGDHQIAVKFLSPEKKDLGKFEAKILKNEDDTWSVNYVPAVGGNVVMHVYLYDQDIQGSPFVVDVAPAKGAIDKCRIEGPGLTASQIYEPTKCIVTVYDQLGRTVKEGVVGVAFGGKQVEFDIIDNGDGTHVINFTPKSPGLLIMSVTVDGKQLKGSPFQLNINESFAVDPLMCNAVGHGLKACIQYRRADFSVFLRDEKNNPVSRGEILLSLKGTDLFEYSVANSDVGSYFVRYKTTADAGDYKLNVTVDGEHIKGSPFFLNVEEGNADDETPLDAGFPRLIRLSVHGKHVLTTLVPLSYQSLNSDDVFLLDNEINVYQWNGPNSSRVLKVGCGYIIKVLNYDRRSGIQHKIIEDPYGKDHDTKLFWSLLGVTGSAPHSFEGDPKAPGFIPRCLSVNEDESIEILSEGSALKSDILVPDKLFLIDTGFEILAWEGRNCPISLKRYAIQAGKDYVRQYRRPEGILIRHVLDGTDNWTIKHFLNQENII